MKRIFASVRRVIAWIGETDDSDMAFDTIQKINLASSPGEVLAEASSTAVASLGRFLGQPYWARVWILQELALAKSSIVQYGKLSLPLESVLDFLRRLHGQGYRELEVYTGNISYKVLGLEGVVREWRRGTNDLVTLLACSLENLATDPRDRVFALSGLASQDAQEAIIPDYHKTLEEVYSVALEYYVEHHHFTPSTLGLSNKQRP